MIRLTSAEFRSLPHDERSKVLTLGRDYYRVTDYVGPIVAAGLDAIERATSGVAMRYYDDADPQAQTSAYRAMEAGRIAALRESLAGTPKGDWLRLASGLMIDWPRQHKAWQTWGGQTTLTTLAAKYLDAMDGWTRDCDALDYEAGINGVSGLMTGHSKINSLDMGFSPGGQAIVTYPWREIAMLIGVQCAPILTRDGVYSVYWHGDWHSWRVVERVSPYLWAWEPIGKLPIEEAGA